MPITAADIARLTPKEVAERTAECTFEYGGEPVRVTYRAGLLADVDALRADFEAMQDAADNDAALDMLAALVCRLVASWDVLECEGGPMYPLDVEHVRRLDLNFQAAVFWHVLEMHTGKKLPGTLPPMPSMSISSAVEASTGSHLTPAGFRPASRPSSLRGGAASRRGNSKRDRSGATSTRSSLRQSSAPVSNSLNETHPAQTRAL